MTTMFPEKVICGNCGIDLEIMAISSTNTFGSPDLDTRPSEMARSTLSYQIQHCSNCDYCNDDISEAPENKKQFMSHDRYQTYMQNRGMNEISRHFMASSFLNECVEHYADAAWDMIHAAWSCDDKNEAIGAVECRKQAVRLIREANKASQDISGQDGAIEAIQADLLRRAGLFDEALEIVNLASTKEYIINRVLALEKKLIAAKDNSVHTIDEALEDNNV